MSLSLADFFCGAGGSSTGAVTVPGVELAVGLNHWNLAVDTHAANHPAADHVCADVSQYDPRLVPHTDLAWFSPSCTKHSVAQGKKLADDQPDLFGEILPDEASERSRATMWDVVRMSEYHCYQLVFVENVVEVTGWPPYRAWLSAMESLGYAHRVLMLNSMHAQVFGPGAPQSRDRFYAVFWRSGNRAPDLTRLTRPDAVCEGCGPVSAVQVWKRHGNTIGKYKAQYVFRCPNVRCGGAVVHPRVRPAADIIDWKLPGTRIGDRARPLAAKTIARIRDGIERYWGPLAVPVEGRVGKQARPLAEPLRTATARNETGLAFLTQFRERPRHLEPQSDPLTTVVADGAGHGLVQQPFLVELRGGGSKHRPATHPLSTVSAQGNHHGLVTSYYGNGRGCTPTGAVLPTVTTVERHGLVTPSGGTWRERATPTSQPIPTRTTRETDGIATGFGGSLDDVLFRMLEPTEYKRAMDFPADYRMLGNRREQVRLAGNAVTPPSARDLIGVAVESLER